MKKLLTPFALLALTVTAAAPVIPTTFTVNCDGGDTAGNGCAGPHFLVSPVDPNVSYQIDAIGPSGEQSFTAGPGLSEIDLATSAVLDPGDWTFEVHQIGNSGNEKGKVLASTSATYE